MENYPHNTKAWSEVPPDYFTPADTIPAGEDFDAPLNGSRYTPYDPNPFAHKEDAPKVIPIVPIEVDQSFSQVKKLPADFMGFRIEIMATDAPLPENHDIFFQHGNLVMEKLGDHAYSYTIGSFENAADANSFMDNFLKQRYPAARLIEYQEGKRVN
ncbi:MAG: hypothetical protein H6564_18175 [Lewinellaceae bacterium]|nr:hypothetical protein [Lewinellaceae bacterium]